jgi:predicted aspartyl protease
MQKSLIFEERILRAIDTMENVLGKTTVTVRVCKVDRPDIFKEVKDVVVDTGSMVSAFPESIIKELGISLPIEKVFVLVDGSRIRKRVGGALLKLDDRATFDDIISVPDGSTSHLGVRALEGMGYSVDPKNGSLKKESELLLLSLQFNLRNLQPGPGPTPGICAPRRMRSRSGSIPH